MSNDLTQDLPSDSDKLDQLLRLVQGMDTRLTSLEEQGIGTRLTSLEEKVEVRLKETRPIWDGILRGVETLAVELQTFREETSKNFRAIDRKFAVLNDQLLKVQSDVLDHESRLEDLERKAS